MCREDDPFPKNIKLMSDDDLKVKSTVISATSSFGVLNTLHALYVLSAWQDTSITAQRITVAIILPSSVNAGNFTVHSVEDEDVLELTVEWPKPL